MWAKIQQFRIVLYIFVFYLVLSILIPLTHDDFQWASSYGMEMLSSHYETLNGRYLGNTLEVFATRINVFRYITYTIFSIIILFVILKSADFIMGKSEQSNKHILIIFMLTLLVPHTIFSQTNGWFAGFYNYVPATIAALVVLHFCVKLVSNGKLAWWEMILMMVTVLTGQWFMENMTLFNIAIILIAVVMYYLKYRKHLKQLLIALVSAIIGAVIMFTNPQYVKIFGGESDYQRVSNENQGLFSRIFKALLTQFPEQIIYQCMLILIIIATLIGIILYRSTLPQLLKGLLITGLLIAPLYMILMRVPLELKLKLQNTSVAFLDFSVAILFYAMLIVSLYYATLPTRLKAYVIMLLLTIPIMVAPLLIVQPIGPRNFYSVFIIYVMVAFILLRFINFKGQTYQWMIQLLTVTFASAYIIMFLIISISDHLRLAAIHRAAAENPKLTTYHMKRLPFEDYMQRSSPKTDFRQSIYKAHYDIPQRIKIIFPPSSKPGE
ncbi:DUF6056 family protein [Staphylococcus agnetis]|uniref:DUF6056 family protein n=1 Tax=Staphylococcus agnetis TaxID=985762 RepID=UPI00208FECCB|nr:DUF6056 family protein [Staphylococcus agnetis]MCO4363784.1 DUF6056 family protein [Staphylococcus agnetis]